MQGRTSIIGLEIIPMSGTSILTTEDAATPSMRSDSSSGESTSRAASRRENGYQQRFSNCTATALTALNNYCRGEGERHVGVGNRDLERDLDELISARRDAEDDSSVLIEVDCANREQKRSELG